MDAVNVERVGPDSASAELQAELDAAVPLLRAAATDLETIEVKSAAGGYTTATDASRTTRYM